MKYNKTLKNKIINSVALFILLNCVLSYLAPVADMLLKKKMITYNFINVLQYGLSCESVHKLYFYGELIILLFILYLTLVKSNEAYNNLQFVTDTIQTPVAYGNGQHGTAKWLNKKKISSVFSYEYLLNDTAEMLTEYLGDETEQVDKLHLEIDENELNCGISMIKDVGMYEEKQLEEIMSFLDEHNHLEDLIYNPNFSASTIKKINDCFKKGIDLGALNLKILSDDAINVVIDTILFLHSEQQYNSQIKTAMRLYAVNLSYNTEQIKEIMYGFQDYFPTHDIKEYATNIYTAEQMRELRLGIKAKIDISAYKDPRITAKQMNIIRRRLKGDETATFCNEEEQQEIEVKEVMPIFKEGGLVIGKEDLFNKKEKIYFIGDDLHSLIIGSTGCGKTRHLVLQSIGLMGSAGDSMIITDIKGELYDYTSKFLLSQGYQVIPLNFKNPMKSKRYNFLQPVIDYINEGNIGLAIQATWDITGLLCGAKVGSKTEPIWENGEAAVVATAIMAVVYDNKKRPWFQNLANVYYFLANMCQSVRVGQEYIMPINKYMEQLNDYHPARQLLAIGAVAPDKTRGSFYTAALTTLRLFTNPMLADMTSSCEFNFNTVGINKTAVFIILPDSRDTYNSIAALYVSQQYQSLSDISDKFGGRLKRRVNFLCDEFGNFPPIPNFASILTVSRSKGIRFNLFLQDFGQLKKKYDEDESTIKGNCIWLYLATNDTNTREEISKKLGKYTIGIPGNSTSEQKYSTSTSKNVNLGERSLLTPDEVGRINRPYSIVMLEGEHPAIMVSPNLHKWKFCQIYGMGTKEHDLKLRFYRQREQKSRMLKEIPYWEIHKEVMEEFVTKIPEKRGRTEETSEVELAMLRKEIEMLKTKQEVTNMAIASLQNVK